MREACDVFMVKGVRRLLVQFGKKIGQRTTIGSVLLLPSSGALSLHLQTTHYSRLHTPSTHLRLSNPMPYTILADDNVVLHYRESLTVMMRPWKTMLLKS